MSPRFGPNPDMILSNGSAVSGHVIGIEVKTTNEETSVRYHEYAVEAGGTTYGIRQDLSPADRVRLGMPVTLKVDGHNAVIDWKDSGTGRWKMLRKPPAAGILDDHDETHAGAMSKAQRGGRAATVTILEFQTRKVAMGLGSTLDASVRVDPAQGTPYEATIASINRVPSYAAHLPIVGARLPAWETRSLLGGEGVLIDWAAAAVAEPGIDAPPADLPTGTGFLGGGLFGGQPQTSAMSMGGNMSDGAAGADTDPDPEIPEYAKKLMRKFGVNPDTLKHD
jgi:hypothetical protein